MPRSLAVRRQRRWFLGVFGVLTSLAMPIGCKGSSTEGGAPTSSAQGTSSAEARSAASTGLASAAQSASAAPSVAPPAAPKLPGNTDGCGENMVRVTGDYCPGLIQKCLEHHPEYLAAKEKRLVSERCLRYEKPSKCISKVLKPLDFCMDRYEWPNKVGELPRVLTSWREARKFCQDAGKRLCTEEEFNFACEGPEGLPHVYGYIRSDKQCNMDKPYRQPDQSKQLPTYDHCEENAFCKSEMERLDQRHRIGERNTCVSWAGVIDMNGNVNEWVDLPGKEPPNRSGLKGGWWGPVRNRCRPTVTFHKEMDYGYEAGFRCCTDPAKQEPSKAEPTKDEPAQDN